MKNNLISDKDLKISNQFIKWVPDKYEYPHTTSKLFKLGLIQYFTSKKYKKSIIEMGCSNGMTSVVLLRMANRLVCVDSNKELLNQIEDKLLQEAKKSSLFSDLDLNKSHFNHLETQHFDLYSENFEKYCNNNNFDVAFIDAKHDLSSVLIDLKNAHKLGVQTIILDDYGFMPDVVDYLEKNYINTGDWSLRYIGYPPGTNTPFCAIKIMSNWEGVILEKLK